jgi:polyhydroxybutyrate depolymerase
LTQCAEKAQLPGNECLAINERDAIIHKPSSQVFNGIALFLHGSPGNARKVMDISDAKMIADKYNLIALSPHRRTST